MRARLAPVKVAALLAATAMLFPAAPAHAEPPGDDDRPVPLPPGVTMDQVERQQELDESLSDLWKLVPNDGADAPGFASAIVHREVGRVVIYWKGKVPNEILALQKSNPRATVEVLQAPYSQRESDRVAAYVFAQAREGRIPQPTRIGLNATANELQVAFTDSDFAKISVQELKTDTEAATGVTPTVVNGTQRFVAASRQNDSTPWYGGSAMTRVTGGKNYYCSTGFAISKPDTPTRILSAAHCDLSGNLAWKDGAGDPFSAGGADISVEPDGIESMIIYPTGGATGRVYGGPWNATPSHVRYSLKVGGSYSNSLGDYVCLSGAMSGENCLATQIYAINQNIECPDNPGHTCKLHLADNSTQIVAIGDSGGPVYALRSDGRVSARGIISALAAPTTCSISTAQPTLCSYDIAFAPISTILTRWGRTVMTTP